ncbi:hypothetical protein SPHINGO8AM_210074 [Sphingomonas sp. 8AM]|nr:hypothetical protein SPHINGO8AM_210074 [Sphingomonas sp. 8AM]
MVARAQAGAYDSFVRVIGLTQRSCSLCQADRPTSQT